MAGEIILFDGDCTLCGGTMRWLRGQERAWRFRFEPQSEEVARSVFARRGIVAGEGICLVLDFETRAERVLVGSEAVLAIAQRLGGIYALGARAARIFPWRWRENAYQFFARRRGRWLGGRV